MNINKKKHDFYAECVRNFNKENYISNYVMEKQNARFLYNSVLRRSYEGPKLSFFMLLVDLRTLRIIKKPKNYDLIIFEENVFNAIIKDEAYSISKPVSKKIVTQSFAFKEKTMPGLLHNGLPSSNNRRASKSNIPSDLVIEVTPGHGSSMEHVNCFNLTNVCVRALNQSLEPIDIVSLKSLHKSNYIQVPPFLKPVRLLPGDVFRLNISVKILEIGAYNCPLLIEYSCKDRVILVTKQIYLNYYPEEYNDLLPIAPYRRRNPVLKETDIVIISGELPKSTISFKPKFPLSDYKLSKDFIHVINAGLKLEEVVGTNSQKLCKTIIDLLNVPNRESPLTPSNYCDLLDLLLKLEEHQMQIDIKSYDINNAKLEKVSHRSFKLQVPGLSEHRPSLIIGDMIDVSEVNSNITYRGHVHLKELNSVTFPMNRSFIDIYVKGKSYHVSFHYNRTTIKQEHRAVECIMKSNVEKCFFPTITGDNMFKEMRLNWQTTGVELNKEQKSAVQHILSNTSYPAPYLIFGPPGTGKTMTVVEAILQVYKTQPNKKILVCTPSNNAANVINSRLTRIPERELLRYISYSFPYKEIDDAIKKYCNYKLDEYFHPHVDDVLKYRIVITTLSTAGRLFGIGVPVNHFDYVFIDESGHATETETLIPIAGLFCDENIKGKLTGQIVMAGDPKQLGPIVHSTVASSYGFGTSMLERLMNTINLYKKNDGGYNSKALTKLLENYRSHGAILQIPNDKFYDGELICKAGPLADLATDHEILINKKFPMIFHCAIGQDIQEESSPSYFNIIEVAEVMNYLSRLIGCKMKGRTIEAKDIGIITPYRKQVQKLKQKCSNVPTYKDITIGSVEQFQGQERLIIIISTVRSSVDNIAHDQKFHLGFVKNPKRFNVAITRAKALVIVIGNPHLLQYDEYWRAYIEACVNNNSTGGQSFTLKSSSELSSDETNKIISDMASLQISDDKDFKRGNV